MLDLTGSETEVDFGAGSGLLSILVALHLPEGIVYTFDESPR
jgi:tRNA A58 N-methylase Trm61